MFLLSIVLASAVTVYGDFVRRTSTQGPGPENGLLMLMLDVVGDSRSELFVAARDSCGTGGCGWWVYSPRESGRYRCLGNFGFHPRPFRFDRQSGRFEMYWHASAREGTFGCFRFTPDVVADEKCTLRATWPDARLESRIDVLLAWPRTVSTLYSCDRAAIVRTGPIEWHMYFSDDVAVPQPPDIRSVAVE